MKNTLLKAHFFIFIILISLAYFEPAKAQIRNQVFVGTRPLSLGETFVAIADDGNAIYWNPAGLARMERIQISGAYANLFGLDIDSYYASFLSRLYFIPPLTDYLSFGVAWSGFQTSADDEEFIFSQDQFNFALALKPPKSWPFLRDFGFGMSAKYLQINGKLDGATEADLSGWGWDFGMLYDLGALRYAPKGLNFGLMIHDVGGTNVVHDTGVTENEFQRQNIRWGLSYRPFKEWRGEKPPLLDPLFAIDIDDRVHFGVELWLAQTLALRFGLQKDRHTDESMTLSFGIGLQKNNFGNWPGVQIDYSLSDPPTLPNTNSQFGGSIIIRDDPRLLRVEGVHINNVFASLYPSYAKPTSSFGVIKLKNVHDKPITALISFQANKYTQPHTPDTVVVKPDSTLDHILRANFVREILQAKDNSLSGNIKVIYEYKNTTFSAPIAGVDFTLYGKNYITWDNPAKASAFITPLDSSVIRFSRQVNRLISRNNEAFINFNVSFALAVFEALSTYGVMYSPDANTPYYEVPQKRYYLDTVQYPGELLKERQGDCDDLSVLYAALLESAGISTALLSIPKHLFMMLDTGVPVNQRYRFLAADSMLVFKDGKIWLPVDIAQIDSSFLTAWDYGATLFRKNQQETKLKIFEFKQGRILYEPTPPDHHYPASYPLPNFAENLERTRAQIQKWNKNYLDNTYFSILEKQPDNLPVSNLLGTIYAQNGQNEDAKKQFKSIYYRNPEFVPALNNLANVYFIEAQYDSAEYFYQKALDVDPYSVGTYLNLGMLFYWRKDIYDMSSSQYAEFREKSLAALEKAGRLFNNDHDRAIEFLGLPEDVDDEIENDSKAFKKIDWKRLWRVFKREFHKIFKPKTVKTDAVVRAAAPKAGETDNDRAVILWWST